MNFISLLLTLFVGVFILIGSLCGINYKTNKKLTDFSISMAFGVIIFLIIFSLIPETFEVLNKEVGVARTILSMIVLVLIGIVSLKLLDVFIPHHEHESHHHHNHEHTNNKCHNEHLHHIGIISSVAIIIHNLIEGMSLYLVSSKDLLSGLLLCLGIGLHNVPMGLVIATTLISASYTKNQTLKLSLVVSISTFIGGLVMFLLGGVNSMVEGVLLGLTIGMLIYILIFELYEQISNMNDKKIAIFGVTIGSVLIILSILLEHVVE